MAIRIKLFQKKDTNKNIDGKWYGRVVKRDEVHTKELARSISHNTTLTEADVQAAIIALVEEMKLRLQGGDTVVLDGFGPGRLQPEEACDTHLLQVRPSRHAQSV